MSTRTETRQQVVIRNNGSTQVWGKDSAGCTTDRYGRIKKRCGHPLKCNAIPARRTLASKLHLIVEMTEPLLVNDPVVAAAVITDAGA